ncbi:MAG: acyl-CoA thioesterase [Pseudohongiellaceae bacterium]
MDVNDLDEPVGDLALQTLAMPRDTNAHGDIFGGWLVSQMDLAAGIATRSVTSGRTVTVAIQNVAFLLPVTVGSMVSCYAKVGDIGTSSMKIEIEVWVSNVATGYTKRKAAQGTFVFVAIDQNGRPQAVHRQKKSD